MTKISQVKALQVLDSRGNPTVEAIVRLENGQESKAIVPSGASTGIHEAAELRDNDPDHFGGKGVMKAVENVEKVINSAIVGMEAGDLVEIDRKMRELDGSENKSKLGANAILAVSMAVARAGACATNKSLYSYIGDKFGSSSQTLPTPYMNVINGGKHASGGADFQEFMIVPQGFEKFSDKLEAGVEVFMALKSLLIEEGFSTLVGDEGGFAPGLGENKKALEYLMTAIEKAGFKPGEQVALAMDPAVSELLDKETGKYRLKSENRELSREELINYWDDLVANFPIVSIEDGLEQDDWQGWQAMTERLGGRCQLVGDDFLVTNTKRLERAINEKCGNAILVKVNQIGTVTEAVAAIKMANDAGWKAMVSHRSGESEDTFIADLVVGMGTGQIKTGSLSRTDRIAKYNRLLEIEKEMGEE